MGDVGDEFPAQRFHLGQLLDLGKLQAGAWTPDFQPLSLSALTDEVLSQYRRLVEREGCPSPVPASPRRWGFLPR